MNITIFSVTMAVTWFSLFVLISALLRKKTAILLQFSIMPLVALMAVRLLRLLFPFELPGIKVVISRRVLPLIMQILNQQVFLVYNIQVTVASLILVVSTSISIVLLTKLLFIIYQDRNIVENLSTEPFERADKILRQIVVKSSSTKRSYSLITSNQIGIPMCVGYIRPKILLPAYAKKLMDDDLGFILQHEWNHYLRIELWKKLFIHILVCLMWWNPCVHILKRDINQMLEISCDLNVTHNMDDREKIGYLDAIIKTLKELQSTNA